MKKKVKKKLKNKEINNPTNKNDMAIAQLIYETSKLIFYIIGNPKNIFIINLLHIYSIQLCIKSFNQNANYSVKKKIK